MELEPQKIVDSTGTPVMVSAVLTYKVVDPLKALYAVEDYNRVIKTSSSAVLKQVVGVNTYAELRTNTSTINATLLAALNPMLQRRHQDRRDAPQ